MRRNWVQIKGTLFSVNRLHFDVQMHVNLCYIFSDRVEGQFESCGHGVITAYLM